MKTTSVLATATPTSPKSTSRAVVAHRGGVRAEEPDDPPGAEGAVVHRHPPLATSRLRPPHAAARSREERRSGPGDVRRRRTDEDPPRRPAGSRPRSSPPITRAIERRPPARRARAAPPGASRKSRSMGLLTRVDSCSASRVISGSFTERRRGRSAGSARSTTSAATASPRVRSRAGRPSSSMYQGLHRVPGQPVEACGVDWASTGGPCTTTGTPCGCGLVRGATRDSTAHCTTSTIPRSTQVVLDVALVAARVT